MTQFQQASEAPVATAPRRWRLHAVYPHVCQPVGIAGISLELCDAIERSPDLRRRFEVNHWVAAARPQHLRANQHGRSHPFLVRLAYRLPGGAEYLRRRTIGALLQACAPGDVALIYPVTTAHDTDALRRRGAILVHDPVNTAHPHGWHALLRAYAAAGIDIGRGPDEQAIADERRRIQPGDFLFAVSPEVLASHRALGLSPARIIPTSLGFDPGSFRPVRQPASEPRFLFVGRGCVRKGLPVLLMAWERARIRGRLVLVGSIDEEVAAKYGPLLAASNVEVRGYVEDLTTVYGAADVFVLPSFEEGSPLVTYMALAAGLPSLLSPAAAGWVVRDGGEGLVVQPDDVPAMVEALRRLADDASLRQRLGEAAAARAPEFAWDRVAAQRFTALDAALHAAH